jgi:hypothetical protein
MARKLIWRKIPTYGFTKKRKILAVPCLSIDMFALHVVYIQSYLASCLLAFFTYIVQTRAHIHVLTRSTERVKGNTIYNKAFSLLI